MNEPIKVIIENLPKNETDYFKYISILISLLAVIISFISIYYTRKSFLRNSRPYVWSGNFGFIDSHNKLNVVAQTIMFQTKNVPAQIRKQEIKIILSENAKESTIHSDIKINFVRYPSEKNQWTYNIDNITFQSITQNANTNNELKRSIRIEYSALNDNEIYFHQLEQKYDIQIKEWLDISETAN